MREGEENRLFPSDDDIVTDNQISLGTSERYKLLAQDVYLFKKMAPFNKEHILGRAVQAKGSGAGGTCIE